MLLRPKVTCDEAIKFLEDLSQRGLSDVETAIPYITNVRSADDVQLAVRKYDFWTGQAELLLRTMFADPDVITRPRQGRYRTILTAATTSAIAVPTLQAEMVFPLLHIELSDLRDYFARLANELRELKATFAEHKKRTLVLDTNDLLHYSRYDKLPWQRAFGKGTVVVIPHVVVDEIDKKSYEISSGVRRRARGVYGLIETTLDAIAETGTYTASDGTVVEILLDEPGHIRIPNNDEEIVARACYLQQAIAPTPVWVVTGDNGTRGRAMAWGLTAKKLDERYKLERLSPEEKAADLAEITPNPTSDSEPQDSPANPDTEQ